MSRRATAAQLKRRADLAQARETYLARTDRPVKTAVDKRPRTNVLYHSYLIKEGNPAASFIFSVQASEAAMTFFGGAEPLGLVLTSTYKDPVAAAPRHWQPAKLNAMLGVVAPTAYKSPWGTRVVKYHPTTAGEAQAFYSCPISANVGSSTYDAVDAKATAVFNALKAGSTLGSKSYARFYLSPEMFNNHKI
jgi:hypothetical protein